MLKTKLSYRNRSDWVQFVTKTREDNGVTNSMSLVYVEIDTELSWLIGSGVAYGENWQYNDVTDHTGVVYHKNDTELSWPIELGAVSAEN